MTQVLSQEWDYLGTLGAKLRDLKGLQTLIQELVQNADDAQAERMYFDMRADALVVWNSSIFEACDQVEARTCGLKQDGAGQHMCDFHRFRRLASGDKRNEDDTTGAFGLGFISVYQITDRPELVSNGRHWTVRPDAGPGEQILQERVAGTVGTLFRLPWAFNPDTTVRRELRLDAVTPAMLDSVVDDLRDFLPDVLLFLRHLKQIELRRDGVEVLVVERQVSPDGSEVLITFGNQVRLWRLFVGSFADEAAAMRRQPGSRIESKRRSQVTIAVPEDEGNLSGLFYAFLPTKHRTGLPFHINADFYPSSDRKRILFDDDYQGRWNETAVATAADVLADSLLDLRPLLRHEGLWRLLSEVERVHSTITHMASGESVLRTFWERLAPVVREAKLVWTSREEWESPAAVWMLGTEEEERNLPLLHELGLSVVHPHLRRHHNLLLQVGVKRLSASRFAEHLQKLSLPDDLSPSDAPGWLSSTELREQLGREIQALLSQRLSAEERRSVERKLSTCPLALTVGGRFRPTRDLLKASFETVERFTPVMSKHTFIAPDNHPAIMELTQDFEVKDAVKRLALTSIGRLRELWRTDRTALVAIIDWFAERLGELRAVPGLVDALKQIPIWPAGDSVHPLSHLYLPGSFEDPLGLTQLLEASALDRHRDFLLALGVKELSIGEYVANQIARTVNAQTPPDSKLELVAMLAQHFRELQDDDRARKALQQCPIIECSDGRFVYPRAAYLVRDDMISVLGESAPIAVLPDKNRRSIEDLLLWLGVATGPRPADIVNRVRAITLQPPSEVARAAVQAVVAHLSDRWDEWEAGDLVALEPLKRLRWLPVRGDAENWHAPNAVYAISRSYLFASQAKFLDVKQQDLTSELLDYLQIRVEPTPDLVVRHLRHCVRLREPVHQQVYEFLERNHTADCISYLEDEPCIHIEEGRYARPDEVFWEQHPFGRFRYRLSREWGAYERLLTVLGVRDLPEADDAIQVLQQIGAEFGTVTPLDEEAHQVLLNCWSMLSQSLENETIDEQDLHELQMHPVIPSQNKLLKTRHGSERC